MHQPEIHKADDPLVEVATGHCDLLSAAIWAHKADHPPRHVPAGQHHLLLNFGLGNTYVQSRRYPAQQAQRAHYSFFSSIAGLVLAALRVCQRTDARERSTASRAAATKIHQ